MSEQTAVPLRILVIVAHPDDAEFGCGGTLARWSREGHKIHLCLCTDGNHGSNDPDLTPEKLATIRQREQLAAASHVEGSVSFLGFHDAELMPTLELRKAITRVIRQVRPHIVICQDPTFYYSDTYSNHPDHRAAGDAAMAAVMPSASLRLIFPELMLEGLEPYEVPEVYLMMSTNADTWVSLTEDDLKVKMQALREHVSQLGDWDPEPMVKEWAQRSAAEAAKKEIVCEYAEGYKVIRRHKLDEVLAKETQAAATLG